MPTLSLRDAALCLRSYAVIFVAASVFAPGVQSRCGAQDDDLRAKIRELAEKTKQLKSPQDQGKHLKATDESLLKELDSGVKMGWPEAMWLRAKCHEQGVLGQVDFKAAVRLHRKACESGYTPSTFSLADLYRVGFGVEQDRQLAMMLYRLAAHEGDVDAMNNIGFAYAYGDGVQADADAAVKWLTRAAELKSAAAMGNLGFLYMKGVRVKRDDKLALEWLVKGDAAGDKKNTTNLLGIAYASGRGTGKDYEKARKCFFEAAKADSPHATWNLGVMMWNGLGGAKDREKAEEYFKKAKALGVSSTNRDTIDLSIIE